MKYLHFQGGYWNSNQNENNLFQLFRILPSLAIDAPISLLTVPST